MCASTFSRATIEFCVVYSFLFAHLSFHTVVALNIISYNLLASLRVYILVCMACTSSMLSTCTTASIEHTRSVVLICVSVSMLSILAHFFFMLYSRLHSLIRVYLLALTFNYHNILILLKQYVSSYFNVAVEHTFTLTHLISIYKDRKSVV